MNSDSIIIFENVFKSYKGEEVLENIDFKVKRGEFVFLIGPSGAGKSTIIKLLNREEFPTSGKIFIDGTDLSTVPFEEMHKIRRKIGVVFQDFRVIKSKNVFENVAISLEVVNSPTDVIQEVVPNILGMVGLQNKIYKNSMFSEMKKRYHRFISHESKNKFNLFKYLQDSTRKFKFRFFLWIIDYC